MCKFLIYLKMKLRNCRNHMEHLKLLPYPWYFKEYQEVVNKNAL